MGTRVYINYRPQKRYRIHNFLIDMFMVLATYGLWIFWMIFRTIRKYW